MTTRCHILGAGAIGQLFAFRLASAGFHVTLIPRNAGTDRVHLSMRSGAQVITQTFVQQAHDHPEPIEQLWITTKSYDVIAAAESVAKRLQPNADVIVLVNGMGYHQTIANRCAPAKVLAGTTTAGAHLARTGELIVSGIGQTRLGWWEEQQAAPTWIAPLQQQNWACRWETNMQSSLLAKLALNAVINPATAVFDVNNGALLEPPFRQDVIEARKEVKGILEWAGHHNLASRLDVTLDAVLNDTATNSSSMRSDATQGRPTEVEAILGYLLEALPGKISQKPPTPVLEGWLTALRRQGPDC